MRRNAYSSTGGITKLVQDTTLNMKQHTLGKKTCHVHLRMQGRHRESSLVDSVNYDLRVVALAGSSSTCIHILNMLIFRGWVASVLRKDKQPFTITEHGLSNQLR